MKIQNHPRARQAGYSALFITLILVAASMLMLGATLSRTSASARLTDRNCLYQTTEGAAEAAVEKVLARMTVDFANNGEGQVQTNISLYQTGLLPTTAENPYWTNFLWSDGLGHANQIYVGRMTSAVNAPYVALEEQYAGLSGYSVTYRIMANVSPANSTFNYNFTNAVQYDVQLAQIPVFQFALFYNGLLEFSDCATFNITGPVHCNSNIYVGSPQNLTFNSMVTCSGNITDPANAGYGTGTWTGTVRYNGTPTPGFLTGQPVLTLPIGTNSTQGSNVQQILYPPLASDNSSMSSQRYYNKADLVLMISNTTFTAIFKSAANDPAPYTYTTNLSMLTSNSFLSPTNISQAAVSTTNWGYNWNWLSTTNSFFDWRQNQTMMLTQIDVGKMTNWMATWLTLNTNVNYKFSSNNPFNIIYVADWRYTNGYSSTQLSAVRLMDGENLPAYGLTLATPNPAYIWGNYNTPNGANLLSTNTTLCVPSSIACDAITILSPAWVDSGTASELTQTASSDTVNTAIIAGIVPSTGSGSTQFSGGAMNLTRLLEKWNTGSTTLQLNTSIVCLYSSTQATAQFQLPGNYYYAPVTRNYAFDQNYTISTKMPPGTPNICRLVRADWCNPQPNNTNYNNSFLTDFSAN